VAMGSLKVVIPQQWEETAKK